jgi:hypothetical protein
MNVCYPHQSCKITPALKNSAFCWEYTGHVTL